MTPVPPGVMALLARWVLDEATAPTRRDEADAVARLRFAQATRLPPHERGALLKLLQEPAHGGRDRQEGPIPWVH
jgi:hypothetical protein